MNVNLVKSLPVIGSVAGAAVGTALTVGGSKIYMNGTGKPAGAPGSIAHILTNDKLDKQGKADVLKEQTKESLKDALKVTGLAAGCAGAAALATAKSPKLSGLLSSAKSAVGGALEKVSVNGDNLKDMVKGTKVFEKFSALPKPAKAAIAVGAGALAGLGTIYKAVTQSKAGYIEGKHEAE